MLGEVFVLASGPSLTQADINAVHTWRFKEATRRVIVTNTTYQKALWADVLFAMDAKWWKVHLDEAVETFCGTLVTSSHCYKRMGNGALKFSRHTTFGNTGAAAIHFAWKEGAKRIYLLGFDGQRKDGKAHHHEAHPAPLMDAMSMVSWPDQFARLAKVLKGRCEVFNCSRETIYTDFPRIVLEEVLAGTESKAA